MKKNLKKVISAVISLAIAGSLVPASFAAKVVLSDVPDTASYATAVNTLVALNVINGYEDGTFLPDNLITRAEVTKVVVAALNMTESAEGMSGSTQFTDMDESSAWANGYVNAGVQVGFINGMGDGTFAPKANVTYAQIVKMLVSSLNYNEYAEFMGGYPNGYLSIANSEGITDGVRLGADETVTRAQVAQLVYNFLNTPLVERTKMEYNSSGQIVPVLEQMNGKDGNDYKTILTENFDAYFVEGYVTKTNKSGTGLNADQVAFGIAKSQAYDNDDFHYTDTVADYNELISSSRELSPVYVGDTDAANYQGVYATAIIMVDEYDDYVLISFEPSGKNKTASFDFSLIDTEDFEDSNENIDISEVPTSLYFYATEAASKSTKYNLQKDSNGDASITLYVNGYEVEANVANFTKYVLANTVGTIDLVDTYKTDGYYDSIYVSYYETAWVDSVSTSNGKITFKESTASSSLTLDTETNDDLVYHIYYNGEEITLAELKQNDVLSIAYDVTGTFQNSNVYDIYVSRDVQTGKLTGRNDDEEYVTIGGTDYEFVTDFPKDTEMKLSDEFTIYVDYFGRIYQYEIDTVNAKYALIDKFVYSTSEENYRATLFTSEGTAKTYTFDSGKAEVLQDGKTVKLEGDVLAKNNKEATKEAVFERVYDNEYTGNNAGTVKKPASDRIIKYKISSSTGNLTSIEFLTAAAQSFSMSGEEKILDSYKERNSSIGSVKLSSATKIFDGIEYAANGYEISDLGVATVDVLVDDTPYEAYAYGDRISDGTYPVVLILAGEGAYNATSRFAVVTGATASGIDENTGDEIYEIPVMYMGEETTIVASADIDTQALALNKGDVFMFLTDSNGYADQIDVIFNFNKSGASNYESLLENSIVANNEAAYRASFVTYPNEDDLSEDWDEAWNSSKSEAIQIVFGPIMAKANSYYSVGRVANGTVGEGEEEYTGLYTSVVNDEKTTDGVYDIMFNGETDVYEYNYAYGSDSRLSLGTNSSIVKSSFSSSNTINSGDIIPWDLSKDGETPNKDAVNFALALVVDGFAVDVLTFIAE